MGIVVEEQEKVHDSFAGAGIGAILLLIRLILSQNISENGRRFEIS